MDEISGKIAIGQHDFTSFCAGDGSGEQMMPRISRTQLDRAISLNIYKTRHTYSGTGSGTYKASVNFTNWASINNMTSAISSLFYLETTFSSTVVNNLPVFEGPLLGSLTVPINQKAVYNFRAKDADGVVHYTIPPYEPVLERNLLTGLQDRVDDRDLSVTVYPSPSQNLFQVVFKK